MPTYERTRFWTTHNSFSGDTRGSFPEQLNRKVRWLELDVHDSDYPKLGDYRVGHWKPGSEVMLGNGNPTTLLFRQWLQVIADWSAQPGNAGHAPITLVLDMKGNLTDNDLGGDLEDLNQTLEGVFGGKLFTRDAYDEAGGWPELEALRDRFLVVISGDAATRSSYRWCFGGPPALSANATGDVVLAYRSAAGDLRCWSGHAGAVPGRIVWYRKSTYAVDPYTLSEPALAINDDRWVVSVQRVGPAPGSPGPALLQSSLGKMQDDSGAGIDRRVKWFSTEALGAGMNPTVRIEDDRVHAIHQNTSGGTRRERRGRIDRQRRKIVWQDARDTNDPLLPRDAASWNGHQLRCLLNAERMVLCSVDDSMRPVGFRQAAFVERQKNDDLRQIGDAVFFGASADSRDDLAEARNTGAVARGWWFREKNTVAPPSPPQENAAATDTPFEPWYDNYMDGPQTAW